MTRTAQRARRPAAAAMPQLAASQGATPGVESAPRDWSSLLALQATLAGAQWTQALQDMSALAEQAIETQNRWIARSPLIWQGVPTNAIRSTPAGAFSFKIASVSDWW